MSNLKKIREFNRKSQSLQPAWLRDFFEAVDADRVFIWGKGERQTTPYKRERLATIRFTRSCNTPITNNRNLLLILLFLLN